MHHLSSSTHGYIYIYIHIGILPWMCFTWVLIYLLYCVYMLWRMTSNCVELGCVEPTALRDRQRLDRQWVQRGRGCSDLHRVVGDPSAGGYGVVV